VQKDDLIHPFADGDVAVFDVVKKLCQFGKFVIMGCKKCSAFELVGDVLGNCPGQRQAVISACAAADFIEDNERFAGSVV